MILYSDELIYKHFPDITPEVLFEVKMSLVTERRPADKEVNKILSVLHKEHRAFIRHIKALLNKRDKHTNVVFARYKKLSLKQYKNGNSFRSISKKWGSKRDISASGRVTKRKAVKVTKRKLIGSKKNRRQKKKDDNYV